mmetsp:Transcript_32946/g.75865  ORF Transcript_32946/g.75865 Transcript_32946/m.75865 type:complete len:81 (-) Transcript_32946:2273-2515(-)
MIKTDHNFYSASKGFELDASILTNGLEFDVPFGDKKDYSTECSTCNVEAHLQQLLQNGLDDRGWENEKILILRSKRREDL